MVNVKEGDTVKVHYTGTLEDGTVFDSSRGSQPLQFTMGKQQLIPGFEAAVLGMNVGESKTTVIQADQGYGKHFKEMVFEVDRTVFPEEIKPEVGLRLSLTSQDGRSASVTVTQVSQDKVTLDGNHPLAGKTLVFNIEVVEILR